MTLLPRPIAKRLLTAGYFIVLALYVFIILIKPDVFFSDDSYFYFQVAWNFAHGLGSTFNGVMNTNGYHPLWMLICALICKLFPTKLAAIHGIAGALCLADLLALLLVQRIVTKVADNLWPIAFALLVPFSFLSQLGTEGALSGCLLAATALCAYNLASAPTARHALLFNLAAAFAVLARLDNIFIVAFLFLALCLATPVAERRSVLRLQLLSTPIYLLLWGGYIASNLHYFGIFEPVSGMVKSHSTVHHHLGGNLPHTAWHSLEIILPSIVLLGWKRRDLFFRVVELPFTLGVLCHATYIVFRMSGETRWSWYYTSWILLASLLLARVASLLLPPLAKRLGRAPTALAMPIAWACLLLLATAWVKESYLNFYRCPNPGYLIDFEPTAEANGLRLAFAFDKPGQTAYYTPLRVIPLDNLMGNLDFQRQLVAEGVNRYASVNAVDSFIGPPVPFDRSAQQSFCEVLYLDSVLFHCIQTGPSAWMPTSVDVYSRIPHSYVGTLQLSPSQLLWTGNDEISLWRIVPQTADKRE
jgi:hypothetical protein